MSISSAQLASYQPNASMRFVYNDKMQLAIQKVNIFWRCFPNLFTYFTGCTLLSKEAVIVHLEAVDLTSLQGSAQKGFKTLARKVNLGDLMDRQATHTEDPDVAALRKEFEEVDAQEAQDEKELEKMRCELFS